MRVTVLEEIPEDPQLAASWNSLAIHMERPEVFYTYEWALAASRAFEGTVRPLVVLAYDSDRLCGVGALASSRQSHRAAFFLAASTADYCDILSAPDQRSAVLGAVFGELRRLGVADLILTNLPSDSTTFRELPNVARSHQYHFHSRRAYECDVIRLGGDLEREALRQAVRSKERENRGLKKMAKLGPIQITHEAAALGESDLTAIISAQITRFLATNRVSPLVYPERRHFLKELSRLLGQAGWLKISRLELNGEPLAWNYGFRFADSWFWYLPTFKIQYEQFSPGSCLLQLLVQEACTEAGVKRMDLGLGDEAYKRRFANALFTTQHIALSSNSAHHMFSMGRYWLGSKAKKSAALEKQLRTTRDRIGNVRRRLQETGLAATAGYALRRAAKRVKCDDEVLLFEAPSIQRKSDSPASLSALNWQLLAEAAILYAEDPQTLQYLMRCGPRMRRGLPGYVLRTPDGCPVHFLWIADFDGFHLSEIDHKLEAADAQPSEAVPTILASNVPGSAASGAAMIFDCWTPLFHRGFGYYASAICHAASFLEGQQRPAWIFSAAANESSTRGILKAGFEYRFSLVRKRRLMSSQVSRLMSAGQTK